MYIGKGRKRQATIAAFLAPTVAGFLLFSLIPIARSLYISFTLWDILQPAEWVGLENYKVLLGSEEFWRVMTASIYSRKEELRSCSVVLEYCSCLGCWRHISSVQLSPVI